MPACAGMSGGWRAGNCPRGSLTLLRFLRANPIAACLLLLAEASVVFLAFPGIDLWFSGLFYGGKGGFWLEEERCARNLSQHQRRADRGDRGGAVRLGRGQAGAAGEAESRGAEYRRLPAVDADPRPAAPGQRHPQEHLGRPAADRVDAFGGDAPYVEVWRITDWCETNCSFVSGETSSAVWLVAVALVLPKSVRTPATIAAILYALLLSLNRIAFGGHFLSDVVISTGLTLLLVAVVHRVVIERPSKWLSNATLEGGLTRLGGHAGRAGRRGNGLSCSRVTCDPWGRADECGTCSTRAIAM